MTRPRRSHEQKTDQDRERYVSTTIRRSISPTLDEREAVDVDATESTLKEPSQRTSAIRSTSRSRESRLSKALREHWAEVIISVVIGVVIVPLLGWMSYQLYALNREVGELKSQLDTARIQHEQTVRDSDRLEERLQRQIDNVEKRLETREGIKSQKQGSIK